MPRVQDAGDALPHLLRGDQLGGILSNDPFQLQELEEGPNRDHVASDRCGSESRVVKRADEIGEVGDRQIRRVADSPASRRIAACPGRRQRSCWRPDGIRLADSPGNRCRLSLWPGRSLLPDPISAVAGAWCCVLPRVGRQCAVLIRAGMSRTVLAGNRSDLYPESAMDRNLLKSADSLTLVPPASNNND